MQGLCPVVAFVPATRVEMFYSRGQYTYKFNGANESNIGKELNSHRIV